MRVVLTVMLACVLLFPNTATVFASDNGTIAFSSRSEKSQETIQELLLFWDEKELYVQSPTRHEKPISQAAENITVVTAKEIEDMNAHAVAEVLNRVTGVFVDFQGQNFGSSSLLHIQSPNHPSSPERHVLVMLDGVVWNFINSGTAETNSIPVRIIKRIEVIKGPASSSWGSSLGGVINIITKDAGDTKRPAGVLSASYGERNVQDYSAEIAGKAGTVGYYVSAGRQDSGALQYYRTYERSNVYAKIAVPLSDTVKLGLTTGYSEPRMDFGRFYSGALASSGAAYTFFTTATLDALLNKDLSFNASLHTFKQKFDQANDFINPSSLYQNNVVDEDTLGGTGKLVWTHGAHTAVLGVDISHGKSDMERDAGPFLQARGVAPVTLLSPSIDKWALFANDTITLGGFSITPGVRFDHNNITGSFTSPSLGVTYKLFEHTIIRASVARGFTIPPLTYTSSGGLFLAPNPSLKSETVWSYQAGIETAITEYLWFKATAFRHDLKDSLNAERISPISPTRMFFNEGGMRRQGMEFEAETAPLHNVSFNAGYAFVRTDSAQGIGNFDTYEYNLGMKYDDKKSFMADLFGHYVWWDQPAASAAEYGSFLWDLNLRKKVCATEATSTEVFFTAHNIFNAAQYSNDSYINPSRWLEAGFRLKF